jgi:hypothetical protein
MALAVSYSLEFPRAIKYCWSMAAVEVIRVLRTAMGFMKSALM